MKSLFGLFLLFSFTAHAEAVCEISNYLDAIECLQEDSREKYRQGELPHSVGVTKFKKGKEAFELITKKKSTATYVGVVQVHYDEDQMLYYEIQAGKNITPKLIKDINLVDITFYVPELEEVNEEELLKLLSLEIPLVDSMEDFHL